MWEERSRGHPLLKLGQEMKQQLEAGSRSGAEKGEAGGRRQLTEPGRGCRESGLSWSRTWVGVGSIPELTQRWMEIALGKYPK